MTHKKLKRGGRGGRRESAEENGIAPIFSASSAFSALNLLRLRRLFTEGNEGSEEKATQRITYLRSLCFLLFKNLVAAAHPRCALRASALEFTNLQNQVTAALGTPWQPALCTDYRR